MTPLMFIIIASAVLLLLVYWVLSTLRTDNTAHREEKFNFETAPELGHSDYNETNYSPIRNDEVRLSKISPMQMIAQWNISKEMWEKKLSEIGYPFTEGNIGLRVYQTSDTVKSFNIPVNSLNGSHEIFCWPDTAYYAVLGVQNKTFIPLIFSNTVIIHGVRH